MCGIFGVANHPEASNLTYLGLYSLQHRGQESAGIVSSNGKKLFKFRRRKLVNETFDQESFKYLRGSMAIGHVRYSTSGENLQRNVQPFMGSGSFGNLSVAHNGNLTNFRSLRSSLEMGGAVFHSTSDTELILHVIGKAKGETLSDQIAEGLPALEGAYSVLFLREKEMIAVRDPFGLRPLVLGRLDGAPVVASETCAFDLIGATYEREVKPGEMLTITPEGEVSSRQFAPPQKLSRCVFEHIYFARPDSVIFGESVYEVRKRLGRELAREHKPDVDLVSPVPDSGLMTAMGYVEESGLPLAMGLIRNHYVGRTFIEPKQSIRGFGVKVKLNPVRTVLEGKRIAIVDDSIVRGTTSQKIIKTLREAGAREVHLLISSPPFVSPCVYGIDTPTREELIASTRSVEEIRQYTGADSLGYLSLQGVQRALGDETLSYCDACFTERYPTQVEI